MWNCLLLRDVENLNPLVSGTTVEVRNESGEGEERETEFKRNPSFVTSIAIEEEACG